MYIISEFFLFYVEKWLAGWVYFIKYVFLKYEAVNLISLKFTSKQLKLERSRCLPPLNVTVEESGASMIFPPL